MTITRDDRCAGQRAVKRHGRRRALTWLAPPAPARFTGDRMLIITSDPRFKFWEHIRHLAAHTADSIDPEKKDREWWREEKNLVEAERAEKEQAHRDAMSLRTDTLEYLAAYAAEFLDTPLYFLIQGRCGAQDRVMVVKRTYALGARALAMRLDTAPELPPADNLTPEEAYRYVSALMKAAVAEVDRQGGETPAFKAIVAMLDPKRVLRYRAIWLRPAEQGTEPPQPTQRFPTPPSPSATISENAGFLSPAELAKRNGTGPEATRKALDRWRIKNAGGDGYIQNKERRNNEPEFLYSAAAVAHVIQGVKDRETRREIRRTKSSSKRPTE